MKNKHLVLLALFGCFGIYFFQKWPFEKQNSDEIPFLSFKTSELQKIQFNENHPNGVFELQATPNWILSEANINHVVDPTAILDLLSHFKSLNTGKWMALPKNATKLQDLVFINENNQTEKRSFFQSPDSSYLVKILDQKENMVFRYDAQSIVGQIIATSSNSLRNRTVFDINPTEINALSFKNDTTPNLSFSKNDSTWSSTHLQFSDIPQAEMELYFQNLKHLNYLPFADLLDTGVDSISNQMNYTFSSASSQLDLEVVKNKDQWYLESSALPNQWFALPDSSVQYLLFSFGL